MHSLISRTLLFVGLLVCSIGLHAAEDQLVERYFNMKIELLSVQIQQLEHSIALMNQQLLTEQEKFELIGNPSFDVVDNTLKQQGFTLKTFYQFGADNQQQIEEWLTNNPALYGQIQSLSARQEALTAEYDQLISAP